MGTGKSLWALNECLYYASQGYRGHYLMLGDLNISDVVERSCSIFSGLSFAETRMNMGPIYNEMCKTIGDRLSFSCIPAQRITIDEYIDFIDSIDEELVKKGEEKLKFCCIDYDAGFLGSGSDDNDSNLYQSLGSLYGKITELSIGRGKLVIVLSQPNRGSLNLEEIGLDQIGESLRKIQIVDMVITRGRWTGNDNGLGIFRIVKNRHGSYSRSWNIRVGGNFVDIPKGLYERLTEIQEQRDYTVGEIKMMAMQYEREQEAIRQQLASISPQPQRKPQNTPFGKI